MSIEIIPIQFDNCCAILAVDGNARLLDADDLSALRHECEVAMMECHNHEQIFAGMSAPDDDEPEYSKERHAEYEPPCDWDSTDGPF
jgi:hypothetical protein